VDVVQTGVQSGRTVLMRHGTAVEAAVTADRAAFEQRFVDSLNGRRRPVREP
jgi:purine nucleosidase